MPKCSEIEPELQDLGTKNQDEERTMEMLKQLCDAPGVSGYEGPAQKIVQRELEKACDKVWRDRLGNIIGYKRATSSRTENQPDDKPRKLMFAAHVDEIGMMVFHVDKRGFVKFTAVGGLDPRVLMSQRVVIHGREKVLGVIAPKPRDMEDTDKILPIDGMVIDTGMDSDTIQKLVSVGDIITFEQEFKVLNGEVVTGRNFDDRIGVYCMIEGMKRITDTKIDVYAVSTAQEEVGVRGAHAAAYSVDPDIGIALDGGMPGDLPYQSDDYGRCSLGKGTGISIMDRLTIGQPELLQFLYGVCKDRQIAYQPYIGGGTDASAMQRSRGGALSTTIGAPVRYMHSTVQMSHMFDIEQTIELVRAIAETGHELEASD